MKSLSWPLLVVVAALAVCGASSAGAAWYAWHTPVALFDWETVLERGLVPQWYLGCSCYYSSNCRDTNRGTRCDYVGDCMGGSGCLCQPKPASGICGNPDIPGQCDGVCVTERRKLARWQLVTRAEVATFVDLYFQSYLTPAREGGGRAQAELLQEAGQLELTGDWQLEAEAAVHHVMMSVLGRDFLPPTAHSRAAGEPRGQVLRVEGGGVELLDSVREAFVGALAGKEPEAVDRAIAAFFEGGGEYHPHHGGRCYPHGHAVYDAVTPCLIDEVRAALDILLAGVEEAFVE